MIRIIIPCLLVLLVGGCDILLRSSLRITNNSSNTLVSVRVRFANEIVGSKESLDPGEALVARRRPDRAGEATLEFVQNGARKRFYVAYVVSEAPITCEVWIYDKRVTKDCRN
jgi:hypothetical protein